MHVQDPCDFNMMGGHLSPSILLYVARRESIKLRYSQQRNLIKANS